MKKTSLLKLCLLLHSALALSGCWLLGDRIPELHFYTANVLMKDGLPCFNLKDRREKWIDPPEILSLDVFRYPGNETTPVWSRVFSSEQLPIKLSAHECLVYGEGAEYVPLLQQGSSYNVFISAYKDGEVMKYTLPFRLYETVGNKVEICRLKWNAEMNHYDSETCDDGNY